MRKNYHRNAAVFMIVLILTIPFYVSSVFAQNQVADAAASCLEKKQDSDDLVSTLESGPIKTLETIAATLHFTCTAWSTIEVGKNVYMSITGTEDNCLSGALIPSPQCLANSASMRAEYPFQAFMHQMCNIAECKYTDAAKGFGEGAVKSTLGAAGSVQDTIRNVGTEKYNLQSLGPFDNIYTSIALLCPAGILLNLRKLKVIYKTHSCCIDQACTNGVSTENCERQLSEATCMYWEGSIATSIVNIMISFLARFISDAVQKEVQEFIGKYGLGFYVGVITALYKAYLHIQQLQQTFKVMMETFSEPNCKDLGFDKIKDQAKSEFRSRICNLVPVDLNGDGISDILETRCT